MSREFFEPPESDWFLSYSNDNDTLNGNTAAVSGIFPSPPSTIHKPFYEKIQVRRYICGACAENVLEEDLAKHHATSHPETPFIVDMYELFEIDEKCHCSACDVDVNDVDWGMHIQAYHSDRFNNDWSNANYMPNLQCFQLNRPIIDNEAQIQPPNSQTLPNNMPERFRCKVCNVQIGGDRLWRHRSKQHPHIPREVNIFENEPEPHKFECEVCGKQMTEKRFDKHQKKYHPDKYGENKAIETTKNTTAKAKKDEAVANGFRNIRISNEEFERLMTQKRLYEVDGWHYLKDSEEHK